MLIQSEKERDALCLVAPKGPLYSEGPLGIYCFCRHPKGERRGNDTIYAQRAESLRASPKGNRNLLPKGATTQRLAALRLALPKDEQSKRDASSLVTQRVKEGRREAKKGG